jgi:hypothetical protein
MVGEAASAVVVGVYKRRLLPRMRRPVPAMAKDRPVPTGFGPPPPPSAMRNAFTSTTWYVRFLAPAIRE